MLGGIDHVAVAVADLDAAIAHFERVWELGVTRRERVEDQGVEEAMLTVGGSSLQLLGAISPEGTVGRFLASRGEGLHHIAFRVDDLAATLAELDAKGVELIDRSPRPGGGGQSVAFVHPKSNHGLLVELVQATAE
ncbi:methylmalonyl-CoA epimerase [soil metagenome]